MHQLHHLVSRLAHAAQRGQVGADDSHRPAGCSQLVDQCLRDGTAQQHQMRLRATGEQAARRSPAGRGPRPPEDGDERKQSAAGDRREAARGRAADPAARSGHHHGLLHRHRLRALPPGPGWAVSPAMAWIRSVTSIPGRRSSCPAPSRESDAGQDRPHDQVRRGCGIGSHGLAPCGSTVEDRLQVLPRRFEDAGAHDRGEFSVMRRLADERDECRADPAGEHSTLMGQQRAQVSLHCAGVDVVRLGLADLTSRGQQELPLGGPSAVQRRCGHPGPLRDRSGGQPGVALVREQRRAPPP